MNRAKITFSILLIPLGIYFFVYGGYDDSPGAQLIGVAVALAGIAGIIGTWRKSRAS
jgi:hypothetical protein